jgi:hypothetical protein
MFSAAGVVAGRPSWVHLSMTEFTVESDVADRAAMTRRGSVEHPGALVVASEKLLGDARN